MVWRRQLQRFGLFERDGVLGFGPFNSGVQRRWRKPVDSARTRLESRTLDPKLDKLMARLKNLRRILELRELVLQHTNGYASVELMSRWRYEVGVRIKIGAFLAKYPRVFEIFVHPTTRVLCCRFTAEFNDLIAEEEAVVRQNELAAVHRLKRFLMMSGDGCLSIHALWLIRRELGLPDDFRNAVLPKYPCDFTFRDLETLSLVSADENLASATVEKWREEEYTTKWLRESETKFAFPINFPTGFRIEKGFREKLKNWQMLSYVKPYDKNAAPVHNVQRTEKRAVGIIHELLSLFIDKMIPVERLSHFRRPFQMEVNVRELLLKHPGIFYISTKGTAETVFLREAYCKGQLIEPNPVHNVRRKMLDLLLLRQHNTSKKEPLDELVCRHANMQP